MFHLTIVTPEKTVYEDDITMLIAPTVSGEVGILTNHHPLVGKLGLGALRIQKGQEEQVLILNGGHLEVSNNQATILANVLEYVEEIEQEQAKQARERAQAMLKSTTDVVEQEKLEKELQYHMMRERMSQIHQYRKKG